MAFMTEPERAVARVLSDRFVANPFLPDWVNVQRRALGQEFVVAPPVWYAHPDPAERSPNITRLNERIEALAVTLRGRLVAGADPGSDALLYQDLSTYLLFASIEPELKQHITGSPDRKSWPGFARFAREVRTRLDFPALRGAPDPAQLLALFFQIRRFPRRTEGQTLGYRRPDKVAVELEAYVKGGWFGSEAELIRAAVLDVVRRNRIELLERFMRDDIAWAFLTRGSAD